MIRSDGLVSFLGLGSCDLGLVNATSSYPYTNKKQVFNEIQGNKTELFHKEKMELREIQFFSHEKISAKNKFENTVTI